MASFCFFQDVHLKQKLKIRKHIAHHSEKCVPKNRKSKMCVKSAVLQKSRAMQVVIVKNFVKIPQWNNFLLLNITNYIPVNTLFILNFTFKRCSSFPDSIKYMSHFVHRCNEGNPIGFALGSFFVKKCFEHIRAEHGDIRRIKCLVLSILLSRLEI